MGCRWTGQNTTTMETLLHRFVLDKWIFDLCMQEKNDMVHCQQGNNKTEENVAETWKKIPIEKLTFCENLISTRIRWPRIYLIHENI